MSIKDEAELYQAIQKEELKQAEELQLLRQQMQHFTDSLNPVTLIRNTFEEIGSYPDLKQNLLAYAKEKVMGFLLDKYMGLRSKNKLMNVLGSVLKVAVDQFVQKRN